MADLEALLDDHAEMLVSDGSVQSLAGGITTDFDDAGRAYGGATPDTVFEIGSITKTFTGTLLALLVLDGTVALDDEIGKHLPCSPPPITLLDLATHTSGLPPLPPNLQPADRTNPYADYTVELLYEAITAAVVDDATTGPVYSNYGFTLLGHVLGLAAGQPFETLVESRIFEPLELTGTSFTSTPTQGHDAAGKPVPAWTKQPTLTGAGGIRSTVADMSIWLQQACSPLDWPLTDAVVMATSTQRDRVGLGWWVDWRVPDMPWPITAHNGASAGFASFMGWHAATGSGVVLLASSSVGPAVDKAAMNILKELCFSLHSRS